VPFDISRLKAQFPLLQDEQLHYLDNAATAQMPDAVLEALRRFETTQRANVHSGVHRLARKAIEAYEGARNSVARFINARSSSEVIFTYGATSAINLLAQSFGESLDEGDEIVISRLEHHSNILPWQKLRKQRGVTLKVLPVTAEGRLDLDHLGDCVTPRCRLIAVTHCSNVTGALTDVGPIVAAARAVGAKVMLDGAQHVPHGPVDVQGLGVDFYAFSGHKMFGPTGIGVLWGRHDLLQAMPPFMVGGQMIEQVTMEDASFAPPPRRFEAGTPPIAGAIGLGAAAQWLEELDWAAAAAQELRLTERILNGLSDHRTIRLLGPNGVQQRRGVISFNLKGADTKDLCRVMDEYGVALRCGHHCAQPLMTAFGLPGTARASLAPYNDDADVDAFLNALEDAVRRLR